MSNTMEQIARLEGAYEQIRDRLNGVDGRLAALEHAIDALRTQLDVQLNAFRTQVDQRFMWLTGILFGTWITTILTVLFHR